MTSMGWRSCWQIRELSRKHPSVSRGGSGGMTVKGERDCDWLPWKTEMMLDQGPETKFFLMPLLRCNWCKSTAMQNFTYNLFLY